MQQHAQILELVDLLNGHPPHTGRQVWCSYNCDGYNINIQFTQQVCVHLPLSCHTDQYQDPSGEPLQTLQSAHNNCRSVRQAYISVTSKRHEDIPGFKLHWHTQQTPFSSCACKHCLQKIPLHPADGQAASSYRGRSQHTAHVTLSSTSSCIAH